MAEEVDEDFFVVLAGDRGEPLHTARSLGKLQGRAGRLQAAVGRMVELHEHLAGLHLRIGDHLRDVVDRGGGDTAGGQRLDDFGLGARARPALDDGGDLVAPVAPGRGRRESGVRREIAPADDLAEAAPDRVAGSGGDRDVAVGRRIDARAGPAERNVARACEDLAADRVALAEVVEGDEQAVQERQVDALAVARSLTVVQRRHDAEGAEHPGVIVRDRLTRAGGRMIGEAGDAHVAADRLGQHVVAALGSVRSVLAEGRDRGVDDVGLHHFEVFVAEPEALESADAEVLGHHVRAANELLEKLDATRGFQLEGDTELVAVPVLRRGHALLDAVAPALDAQRDALLPALPRLDLDHPRSHVGQEHRAEGHGDDLSQVNAMPFCTMLLADMGARVIKVESRERGQERVSLGIKRRRNGVEERVPAAQYRDRNKLGITLELKTPRGVELFKELVCRSDVVTENFSVGTLERLGLGYEDLKVVKPDIIYASITAFGQDGPYAAQRGYDMLAQAISGYMSITGF